MKNRRTKKIIYGVVMIAVFLWLFLSNSVMARQLSNDTFLRVRASNAVENAPVQYHLAPLAYDEFSGILTLDGWAFIPTDSFSDSRSVNIRLRSAYASYSAEVQNFGDRPDLERHFSRMSVHVLPEQAGFRARFPVVNLQNGIYELCIDVYENEQAYGIIGSGRFFKKNGREFTEVNSIKGDVEFVSAQVQQLPTAHRTADMFELDYIDIENDLLVIEGWSVSRWNTSYTQTVSVFITSEDGDILEFSTMCLYRPDVAQQLGSNKYLYSGFLSKIPLEHIEDGRYELTCFVENNGITKQSPNYSLFIDGEIVEYDLEL